MEDPALRMPSRRLRLAVAAIVFVLGLGSMVVASSRPASAATSTSTSVESYLLAWTNRDRAVRGLRPLRLDARVRTLARQRAANLAASTTFSHNAAGGSIGTALAAAGIQWWAVGEDIAYMPGAYGKSAASGIYALLRNSPQHWSMLMSRTYNYIGIGAAERSRDHRTFASLLFTESRDHSAPVVRVTGATRSGTAVSFRWSGHDLALQTHTAGFRDFDVRYRRDGGAWILVRDNTTSLGATWTGRARGHWYWVSVRGRDRNGNVSAWSPARGVYVP